MKRSKKDNSKFKRKTRARCQDTGSLSDSSDDGNRRQEGRLDHGKKLKHCGDAEQNPATSEMKPFACTVTSGGNCVLTNVQKNILATPVKEIVHLSNSVLYPPYSNPVSPATREKPNKSIFVSGMPEKITELIIREIFGKCGDLETIQMAKNKCCIIRFTNESSVERALCFSGYTIKIENKDATPFTGMLHVEEYYGMPTTFIISPYTNCDALCISEKLRGEDGFFFFHQALYTLMTYLDRGECNRNTSKYFYSMIQSTNSYISHLHSQESKYEEDMIKEKLELKRRKIIRKQQKQNILFQLKEIQKVLVAACTDKAWDHFSVTEKKNISLFRKHTEEEINARLEELADMECNGDKCE